MKVIKTSIILIFLSMVQFCYGEILVYKINSRGLEFSGVEGNWERISNRNRGFLVLDLNYLEDGNIYVNDAVQIVYWRDGKNKLYRQDYRYIDVIRIFQERDLYWLVAEKNAESVEVSAEILKGPTEDISNKSEYLPVEIAKKLNGNYLSDIQLGTGHYVDIKNVTLRLHLQWTAWANEPGRGNGDFEYAISNIVVSYLSNKKYNSVLK